MLVALPAADTVVGLTEFGYAAVIAYKECAAGLTVVAVGAADGEVALIDALVVVQEHSGYVDAVGAGHAVLAVVAGDGRVFVHLAGSLLEEGLVIIGQGHERGVGADIVLQVLHVGHAAENRQDHIG